jgi:hypothetical protein
MFARLCLIPEGAASGAKDGSTCPSFAGAEALLSVAACVRLRWLGGSVRGESAARTWEHAAPAATRQASSVHVRARPKRHAEPIRVTSSSLSRRRRTCSRRATGRIASPSAARSWARQPSGRSPERAAGCDRRRPIPKEAGGKGQPPAGSRLPRAEDWRDSADSAGRPPQRARRATRAARRPGSQAVQASSSRVHRRRRTPPFLESDIKGQRRSGNSTFGGPRRLGVGPCTGKLGSRGHRHQVHEGRGRVHTCR